MKIDNVQKPIDKSKQEREEWKEGSKTQAWVVLKYYWCLTQTED